MNVTLCSAFRQASGYAPRYFAQAQELAKALKRRGDYVSLLLAYGDSRDETAQMVMQYATDCGIDALVLEINHGGPNYGSIVHPWRFKQLAQLWNEIWRHLPHHADVVLYAESDLIWQPQTMLALLDDLEQLPPPYGAVAPMIMHVNGFFYDTWAHRRDGVPFTNYPPYHADIRPDGDLLEMDSAGSVLAIDGKLARQLCWPEDDVIVGLCQQIRDLDGNVWLDTQQKVTHP